MIVVVLTFAGCTQRNQLPDVSFVYFNLSSSEIWVENIAGLPRAATPGRLMPVRSEINVLEETSIHLWELVHFAEQIKITWRESNTVHVVKMNRASLGLPAETSNAKFRFTYLGNDVWRVSPVVR